MNPTPPYDDILEDETLAPLKRNHACLQCKKRKVKCDATKPTCSPCLRSHAHAVRSAHRNGTAPPTLTCTYTEGDSPEPSPSTEGKIKKKKNSSDVPKVAPNAGVKRQHTGQGQRDSPDIEKENLKARIAELEARLAVLTPPSSHSGIEPSLPISNTAYATNNMPFSTTFPSLSSTNSFQETATVEPILEEIGVGINSASYNTSSIGFENVNTAPLPESLGDFSGLDGFFLVPQDWPKGLPLPFLLEHLVETFFNYVPQTPRMLHRSTLLARIKLPPSSPDFPFPGLLHAICASAATYTAWVNNLAPHLLEEAVQRHLAMGLDITSVEDFGLSQAHLGSKAIEITTSICIVGSGPLIFQLTQACILLGDVFLQKGFPMRGWMLGGHPARLLAVLELNNRQAKPKGHKKPLLGPPESDIEREERLIVTWMAFVIDSGFTINSNWLPSMSLSEVRCNLPTSAEDWAKVDGMASNPQQATSPDLYYSHPIEDSFVFVIKCSTVMAEVTHWIRNWQQRDADLDDEQSGSKSEAFRSLNHKIEAFTTSLPAALKNIFRYLDSRAMAFDANLLAIHLIPNIATCLLHEPFMLWLPNDPSTIAVQRAYDSIMAVLHLIPSNLDITLILTPFLAMSLYTVGRFIIDFIKNAEAKGQAQTAARYRADLNTMIAILHRYGQRHPLGNAMVHFLEQYTKAAVNGEELDMSEKCEFNTRRIEWLDLENSNNDNCNSNDVETSYLNKIRIHQEIHENYPNAVRSKSGIYSSSDFFSTSTDNSNSHSNTGVNISDTASTSRSNSIAGISPITMTSNSNLSNQHTPESLNNCNLNNNNNNNNFLADLENCSNALNGNGSSGIENFHQNVLGSFGPSPPQQHQQSLNKPNHSSSNVWPSSTTAFGAWDKVHSSAGIPTQPGKQLPMLNFLGSFGTEDALPSIPMGNNQFNNHQPPIYENDDWKISNYGIPGGMSDNQNK